METTMKMQQKDVRGVGLPKHINPIVGRDDLENQRHYGGRWEVLGLPHFLLSLVAEPEVICCV